MVEYNLQLLLIIFIIMHGILLINLLIAMMSNTYDRTTELTREWLRQVNIILTCLPVSLDCFVNDNFFEFFQWALQVLTIEQNVGSKERLKQQKQYMTMIAEKNSEMGGKYFMVRWRQSVSIRFFILNILKVC